VYNQAPSSGGLSQPSSEAQKKLADHIYSNRVKEKTMSEDGKEGFRSEEKGFEEAELLESKGKFWGTLAGAENLFSVEQITTGIDTAPRSGKR